MTNEAVIKELAAAQAELKEMRDMLNKAFARYNKVNYRIYTLKKKLKSEVRASMAATKPADTTASNQFQIDFNNNNNGNE